MEEQYRKAIHSGDLGDIIELFIHIQSMPFTAIDLMQQAKKIKFIDSVEKVFRLLLDYASKHHNRPWDVLFHDYFRRICDAESAANASFSHKQTLSNMILTLKVIKKFFKVSSVAPNIVHEFHVYISSHLVDPYSVLIGAHVHPRFFTRAKLVLQEELKTKKSRTINYLLKKKEETITLQYKKIVSEMLELSYMDHPQAQRDFKALVNKLKLPRLMKISDVVIFDNDHEKTFVRFSGFHRDSRLVFIKASVQSPVTLVELEKITPIRGECLTDLAEVSIPLDLSSFVQLPSERFRIDVSKLMTAEIKNLFRKNGINYDMIFHPDSEKKLEHLPLIEEGLKTIDRFNSEFSTVFQSLKDSFESMKSDYVQRMSRGSTFWPTHERCLSEIRGFEFDYCLKRILKTFPTNFFDCQSRLREYERQIISKKEAERINDTILKTVFTLVDEFLRSMNFDENVIPDDYCRVAPKSLIDVKKNFALLESVVRSFDDEDSHFNAIISKIKLKMYPEMDTMIANSLYIFNSKFGLKLSFNDDLEAKVTLASSSLPRSESEDYISLASIASYFIEMKKRDDPQYCRMYPDFHIVPLSGLARGEIIRRIQDYKSVIEHWDSKINYTLIHAINDNDVDIVKTYLSDELKDTFLVSPFLIAAELPCSREKYMILDILMERIDLDISQERQNKNFLHVICGTVEKDSGFIESQSRIVKKAIELKPALIRENDSSGLQPIHYACKNNCIRLVETLLECGADVNARTSLNDTPLHFASEGDGSFEPLVMLLLKKGACKSRNHLDKEPYDVAENLEIKNLLVKACYLTGQSLYPGSPLIGRVSHRTTLQSSGISNLVSTQAPVQVPLGSESSSLEPTSVTSVTSSYPAQSVVASSVSLSSNLRGGGNEYLPKRGSVFIREKGSISMQPSPLFGSYKQAGRFMSINPPEALVAETKPLNSPPKSPGSSPVEGSPPESPPSSPPLSPMRRQAPQRPSKEVPKDDFSPLSSPPKSPGSYGSPGSSPEYPFYASNLPEMNPPSSPPPLPPGIPDATEILRKYHNLSEEEEDEDKAM